VILSTWAQGGDAILIGLLHARLARYRSADQIVAQDEIGCRGKIADRDRANSEPRKAMSHGLTVKWRSWSPRAMMIVCGSLRRPKTFD
jgi:hypothetical protein